MRTMPVLVLHHSILLPKHEHKQSDLIGSNTDLIFKLVVSVITSRN